MTTPAVGPGTQRWRFRAFVQPLLITIVGVVVSSELYRAGPWLLSGGPSAGPFPSLLLEHAQYVPCIEQVGSTTCGFISFTSAIVGLLFLPVLFAGLLITGVILGRSSRGGWDAFGAVLVALVILALTLIRNPVAPFLALIPIGLGFGVGRWLRPKPTVVPDPTTRE